MESHLFYLFESPESSSAHESVSRLLQYLKTNLIVFKDIALKVNFERLLKSVWTKLLNTIETNIKKDNTVRIFTLIFGFFKNFFLNFYSKKENNNILFKNARSIRYTTEFVQSR